MYVGDAAINQFSADAVDINPDLPENDRNALRNVLQEFPKVWEKWTRLMREVTQLR